MIAMDEVAERVAKLTPGHRAIRNPLPNRMMAESSWSPHWSTEDGVRDVLSFLGVERLVREDQDHDRLAN